jgi:hypothetical protein
VKELPREERGRRAERCREGGEWSAEALKWRREGDGRVWERGQSPGVPNVAGAVFAVKSPRVANNTVYADDSRIIIHAAP